MFTVTERTGPIDLLELEDTAAGSVAQVAPARGAIATRFRAAGREIFYLDEATLQGDSPSVRGGNPVLFPSPGKLEGDRYDHGGVTFSMKQHGFGRALPWRVDRSSTTGAAEVTLVLASSDATRAQYPWDFRAELTYALRGPALRATLAVTNAGDAPMPFAAGFHPYFLVPDGDKARTSIASRATRAYDKTRGQIVPFEGLDLTQPEVDLHLLDHGERVAVLATPRGDVEVSASAEITTWVVWTLQGRDYVCLEPWTAPGGALATAQGLLVVQPGATRSLWIEMLAR